MWLRVRLPPPPPFNLLKTKGEILDAGTDPTSSPRQGPAPLQGRVSHDVIGRFGVLLYSKPSTAVFRHLSAPPGLERARASAQRRIPERREPWPTGVGRSDGTRKGDTFPRPTSGTLERAVRRPGDRACRARASARFPARRDTPRGGSQFRSP